MPDDAFDDPRLVALYDHLEGERDDLVHHRAIIAELGARSVLDVGCGTGVLACSLAAAGLDVVGVDPADAALEVARAKSGAGRVQWILGDATTLPPLTVDLAIMTGNVAQVFTTDESWAASLDGIRRSLAAGGHLVFETRDPGQRAWEGWTPERTRQTVSVDGVGAVESWHDVTNVSPPLVTFTTTFRFLDRRQTLRSTSTLCFRSEDAIRRSLQAAGFDVVEVRDAPDRPGRELVFVAAAIA